MAKKYKRVVDNKMKAFGDIDYTKRVIRVNKKRSKAVSAPGYPGVLDTIVHEELHRMYPKMKEKNVRKEAPKRIKKMSKREKSKYYARF